MKNKRQFYIWIIMIGLLVLQNIGLRLSRRTADRFLNLPGLFKYLELRSKLNLIFEIKLTSELILHLYGIWTGGLEMHLSPVIRPSLHNTCCLHYISISIQILTHTCIYESIIVYLLYSDYNVGIGICNIQRNNRVYVCIYYWFDTFIVTRIKVVIRY